jgi:stearoyl-CoA desaturase (Delta-9 desaturase)
MQVAERAEALPQGVTPMTSREAKIQRQTVLILTLLPLAGFIFAVVNFWGHGLSALDAALALSFYFFTGLGVTVGFHRCFTHLSFSPTRPLKILLAVSGTMAIQGSVISWVATHRRHHAFSDRDGDPHSPHLDEGEGVAGVLKGLWHSHVGWLAKPENTHAERWAPDLLKDKDFARIDRMAPYLMIASFTLPPMIAFGITQSFDAAVTAFLWASLARVFFLHHVTWSINSVCHFFGKRPFETKDYSTNNWPLALLSFGESWHNNHHAFPTSAVHGIGRGQFDMSGAVIRFFAKIRLAKNVHLVTPKQLTEKAAAKIAVRPTVIAKQ